MAISVAGGVRPGKVIEIEHRLYQQLIVGKQKSSSMFDELGEDIELDANKLAVEREAAIERLAKKVEDKQVFERVSKQLVDAVEKAIDHRLASVDSVIKSSGINESQLLILELVQERVIDTNRLISLIENESWLVSTSFLICLLTKPPPPNDTTSLIFFRVLSVIFSSRSLK